MKSSRLNSRLKRSNNMYHWHLGTMHLYSVPNYESKVWPIISWDMIGQLINPSVAPVVNLKAGLGVTIHSTERPYNCSFCEYRCTIKGRLNNHIKVIHTDGKPFSCSQCQFNCKAKGNLTQHTKMIHSD